MSLTGTSNFITFDRKECNFVDKETEFNKTKEICCNFHSIIAFYGKKKLVIIPNLSLKVLGRDHVLLISLLLLFTKKKKISLLLS